MDDPSYDEMAPSDDEDDDDEPRAAKRARLNSPGSPPPPVVTGTPFAPLVVGALVEECVEEEEEEEEEERVVCKPAGPSGAAAITFGTVGRSACAHGDGGCASTCSGGGGGGPADTWRTSMKKNGKRVQVLGSRVDADGGVWGGCHNTCKNQVVDMERFAPAAARCSNGARQRFFAALAKLRTALRAEDWDAVATLRADVERLRTKFCDACLKRCKLSPKERACRNEWDRMRQEACRRNNGCANKGCPERGMEAWIAITADHGKNPKRHDLSRYKWWALKRNGGVDAMREEAKQIHQWICACCHALEDTSNSGRVNHPATMKRKPNETEQSFRSRKRMAAIRFPKYEYVNERKRAIGKCQYPGCGRKVKKGNEASFHFDHRDEGTKRKCRCLNAEGEAEGACHGCDDAWFERRGGVGGLAHNCVKATALEYDAEGEPVGRVKALLDDEMDKCDLLCHNCHICRKPLGLARNEEYARPRRRRRAR